jgi:hypothetical protein
LFSLLAAWSATAGTQTIKNNNLVDRMGKLPHISIMDGIKILAAGFDNRWQSAFVNGCLKSVGSQQPPSPGSDAYTPDDGELLKMLAF